MSRTWREQNRDRYNEYMRTYRKKPLIQDVDDAKREAPYDPRHPSPHGTPQRYRRGGCRCDACRGANAEAQALTRARRAARLAGVEFDKDTWLEERWSRKEAGSEAGSEA